MTNLSHLKTLLELAMASRDANDDDTMPWDEWTSNQARWLITDRAYIAAMSPDRIIPALEEAIAAMEARPRYPSEGVEL